jgi:glycosyltransferase involved in cell wall biosynthesis
MILSNAKRVTPVAKAPGHFEGPMRIGHLSNLGPEKGLNEVLAVLRRLLELNVSVRLVLAGPAVSTDVQAQVEAARTEFGAALEYRGAVYGTDKDDFYRNLDVFLFPTRYRHEAQPNVLFEAMAFAVPSISYARGCVANDLANGGGIAIPTDEDFVEMALPVLIGWERDRKQLALAKQNALARAYEHKRESEAQFEEFVTMLTSAA